MSERSTKRDAQETLRREADSAELAPGRYANTDLVGKGRQGPHPRVPGKRTETESLHEADNLAPETQLASGFAAPVQANHTLEYGAGDSHAPTARRAGPPQPPRADGSSGERRLARTSKSRPRAALAIRR